MSARHGKAACPVCGYQFGPAAMFQGIVGLSIAYSPTQRRQMRWPHRKQSGTFCPECRRLVTIATALSRDELEVAFL